MPAVHGSSLSAVTNVASTSMTNGPRPAGRAGAPAPASRQSRAITLARSIAANGRSASLARAAIAR